jgi:hypothetical protein
MGKKTMEEGCLYGRSLGFPVDATTRSFGRAASEPRFPIRRFMRILCGAPSRCPDSFLLEESAGGDKGDGATSSRGTWSANFSSPARNKVIDQPFWDPHKVGFGTLPNKAGKSKVPPQVREMEGIIGKAPHETCGNGGVEVEEGQPHRCGEPTREDFPSLIQPGGDPSLSSPHPPEP